MTDAKAIDRANPVDADGRAFDKSEAAGLHVIGPEYLLRYATPADVDQLFALGSDPEVTRFFSWGPYTSIEEPLAYITSLTFKRDAGALLEFVIVRRASNEIVGVTGLTEFSLRDRRAVVGSWLGRHYWGTGANRASKSLVLGLGFARLGLTRISAYSHLRNVRSEAALAGIGFQPEGTLKSWHWHRGDPQDVTIHCLLRDQYLRTELARDELEFAGEPPRQFLVGP